LAGTYLVEVRLDRPSEVFGAALHAAAGVPDEHHRNRRLGDVQDVLPGLYGPGERHLLCWHRTRIEAFEALPNRIEKRERGADVRLAEELEGQHCGGGAWEREPEVIVLPEGIDHAPGTPAKLERIGFGGCAVGLSLQR